MNDENITYAKNRLYSPGDKVLIFLVEVTSKTDASKYENDVEEDGPVSQHGHDQRKGEAAEDTAEKDIRKKFGWTKNHIHLYQRLGAYLASSSFQAEIDQVFFHQQFSRVPKEQSALTSSMTP